MQYCIFTEPQQGASYDTIVAHAQRAEALGFHAWFRSDHYFVMGDGDGLPGPTDAWTTLAALARETSTIRLGTLVSSATHRHPGILAVQVAQVDQMSNGRVEFGLGTGWYEREHEAFGIPFPPKRFGMLEEQLAIVTGYWATPDGATFSFEGDHYRLVDVPALPKIVQERMPVIVGGGGPRKTPQLAARYATEFNIGFRTLESFADVLANVRAVCVEEERDPATLSMSAAWPTVVGRDAAEIARRCEAVEIDPASDHGERLVGTPSQVVDQLGALRELGVDRVYLQTVDMTDLDHLELIAAEVLPQLT
jgi:F420-dependent oxidoreductase-like protein